MKKLIILSIIAFGVSSCKKDEKLTSTNTKNDSVATIKKVEVQPEIHKELYGVYNGEFNGGYWESSPDGGYDATDYKKLSIKINRITNDSVYGHSVVNGNQRPFRGIFNESNNTFTLDEPGNDKTDGRFTIKIVKDSLMGSWAAFNKSSVKAPKKELKLIKREFVYNPNFMLDENSDLVDWSNPKKFKEKYTNDETGKIETYETEKNRFASDAVFKLNASKQKLTEKELKNLRKLDLEIIKNAVFARHGYAFKKETYRYFFEATDWYIPVSNNVDKDLSPLEKENVVLLNRFIQYAEDKYDSFGR